MTTISRIKAGQYAVSDGRMIIKQGKDWYIFTSEGKQDFGPVTTLKSAKEFVANGTIKQGQHTTASEYSKRKSRQEHNAYLAAEAKNGNYFPLIITIVVLFFGAILMEAISK